MSHERIHMHDGRGPTAPVASARNAVRRVPASGARLWLARYAATAAARSTRLVLLHELSALLLRKSAEIIGHG